MVDITGKKNAIDVKNEYQKALDYSHEGIKKIVGHLHKMNHKLKFALADTQRYKKDIGADEDEKIKSYNSLNNLLKQEKSFEKEMMKLSQKGKAKNISIKTKFKDVDDVRFNAMQDYLDKYPEYASKPTFKKILDKISEVEKGIKDTKKKYNKEVSIVLRELAYFPKNIMQAEDRVKRFKDQLKEGTEKLKKMRYLKSVAYRLASERIKRQVNIHTLYYRVEENERIIQQLKKEVANAKRQDLEEMDY